MRQCLQIVAVLFQHLVLGLLEFPLLLISDAFTCEEQQPEPGQEDIAEGEI